MIDIQKQIDQLEALANESDLLFYLACDEEAREHSKRCARELREAALRVRAVGMMRDEKAAEDRMVLPLHHGR